MAKDPHAYVGWLTSKIRWFPIARTLCQTFVYHKVNAMIGTNTKGSKPISFQPLGFLNWYGDNIFVNVLLSSKIDSQLHSRISFWTFPQFHQKAFKTESCNACYSTAFPYVISRIRKQNSLGILVFSPGIAETIICHILWWFIKLFIDTPQSKLE